MGRFITRRRRSDRELGELLLVEGRRLYQSRTPYPMAIDRMIELAGTNPDALRHIEGSFRDLNSSAEGRAVVRLMGAADLKRRAGAGEIEAHFLSKRPGVTQERISRIIDQVESGPPSSPSWWPSEG